VGRPFEVVAGLDDVRNVQMKLPQIERLFGQFPLALHTNGEVAGIGCVGNRVHDARPVSWFGLHVLRAKHRMN
jgi:hypothetical protein